MRGKQLTAYEIKARFAAVNLRLLSDYQNAHTPVSVRCRKCHHTYEVKPYGVFQGQGCSRCNKYRPPALTTEEVSSRLLKVGVELRSKYRGSSHRIKVRCNQCRHSWKVFPTSLFQGHGCPNCAWDEETRAAHSKRLRKTYKDPVRRRRHKRSMERESTRRKMRLGDKEIKQQCHQLGIALLSTYKGRDYPLKVECDKCRYQWRVASAVAVLRSKGCPQCHPHRFGSSEAEDRVRKIVERVTGWKLPKATPKWLRGRIGHLRLDGYNEKHQVAFEYQGEQHYKARADWGGESGLAANKRRDHRKRMLCTRHGVFLIRIPYWKKDVEAFLRKKLAQRDASL